MSEMMNVSMGSRSSSSKVTPVFDSPLIHSDRVFGEEQITIDISETPPNGTGGDGFSGGGARLQVEEHNPHDAWLPITESRKGNSLTATLHLLCCGIGVQALMLPLAFVFLGWFWGIICLSIVFAWQFYTIWLLINLHESVPPSGVRYSRFVHLSIVAFGEKVGKLLSIFPTIYLSSGTCVLYIIAGGTSMNMLYNTCICLHDHDCQSPETIPAAVWFLIFISLATFISLFFPNLNSLAWVSLVGSVAAVAYCTMLSLLSQGVADSGKTAAAAKVVETMTTSGGAKFRDVMSGIGFIALAFRGHNLVLEIQGTMPTNQKQPSRKPMLRGLYVSYLFVALCFYPLAIVGYWAYGDKATLNKGILVAYVKTINHNTSSKSTFLVVIYVMITINYLCAFQMYAMPTFDNLERIYVTKRNGPCSRWARSVIKLFYGGWIYFISMVFPFLPSLSGFVGSIALPLTFAYPCFMWASIKKPKRFSMMWCLNLGLGSLGLLLSLLLAISALWSLIVNRLDANFFRPKRVTY